MDSRKYKIFLLFILVYPSICTSQDFFEEESAENSREDSWPRSHLMEDTECSKVQPTAKDIVKRFYSILLYFDKEHANTEFLRKFRSTVHQMSLQKDLLDREAAFYAAVLTPIVFMQRYRDIWCLMERFHRALRLYQVSHPTAKRSSLKVLQNLRWVNQKIRQLVMSLPRPQLPVKTTRPLDLKVDDEELKDKKDIQFLQELVKNLI